MKTMMDKKIEVKIINLDGKEDTINLGLVTPKNIPSVLQFQKKLMPLIELEKSGTNATDEDYIAVFSGEFDTMHKVIVDCLADAYPALEINLLETIASTYYMPLVSGIMETVDLGASKLPDEIQRKLDLQQKVRDENKTE